MPPIKGQMFRYSEADMEAAIADCKRGVATATAARQYGVPRVTLLNKVKGKTPLKRKMGRSCYLSDDIEKMLVTWTKAMAKQGFPIGKDNLQDSAKKIVDKLNVETPFKNGRPGKRWFDSFLKRHPDLIIRQPQNLTASRALVSKTQINNWFSEVDTYLKENIYKEILNEPQRVFNADETAFFLNPKGNKVLAAKGDRSVYQKIATDEKECYTVLLGGNAAGDVLPPMVIFRYERIPRELSLSVPESWGIGRSDNGWMTMETFYEYICNIFNKWLDDNNIARPVLLFIDGHTSHLSFNVSKFCSENGIILVALFPTATHLLQPMDVAVFRSLKGAWKAAVHSWRLENIDSPDLRKIHFCPLLNKVLKNTLVPEIFRNGFRKCGLVPWNPDEVCCIMEPPANASTDLTDIQKMSKIKELELGLKFLDKHIDTAKIAKFKSCNEFVGDREDIGLFKFYKSVETSLNNLINHKTDSQSINTSETTPRLIIDSNIDENLDSLIENQKTTIEANPIVVNANISLHIENNHITPKKVNTQIIQNPQENENRSAVVMPSTSRIPVNEMKIPSPFKSALFWPSPKDDIKKRKKEKIPSVITSLQWQKYHEDKEKKKIEFEEEKKRKKEERKKKKEQIEEERKLKTAKKLAVKTNKTVKKKTARTDYDYSSDSSSQEEWQESGDSLDDISDNDLEKGNAEENKIKQGDYVIVNFPGKKRYHSFLCIVQNMIKDGEMKVMAMVSCDETKTSFKENDKDISIIRECQIVEILETPKMIIAGNRIKYKFDFSLQVDG